MRPILLRSRIFYGLLSVLLLSLTCFYSNAQASEHRVTINGIVPLKAVFKAIKKQTGFAVMYNTNITMLNQEEKVSVDFKETPLDEVLTFLLRGKGLGWTYNDDVVVIHKKEVVAPKKNEGDSTVTPAMLTGKVTDAAGSPLPGVTVQVKGTMQGTTTDAEGKFSLAKVANGDVLVVSSIGFETRAVTIKGRSVLVELNLMVSGLDETVVIAYGETTRRLSTGNIATVKAKDIAKQPVNNPLLALQGRVPGLFITQNNGIAGGGITVRVQGQNSLLNGNDPLYIVDGVPIPSQLPTSLGGDILKGSGGQAAGGSIGYGHPLSYINPSDIESIDILKDADATAIYGSRAANGAILITTKKGRAGATKVEIDLQQGIGQVHRRVKMLNTPQYLEMRHEALKNDGLTPDPDAHYDLTLWDTTRYTDWQKVLIGNKAKYTNINASVSGGTTNLQYLIGGTYHRETSVFPRAFADQKGTIHFNINSISANQKFHIQLTGNYMVDDNQLPASDLTQTAVPMGPNAPPLYNANGTLNWAPNASGSSTWINPLAALYREYNNLTNNLISNAVLGYRIIPGLEIRSSFGYTILQSDELTTEPLASVRPERRSRTVRSANYGTRNLNTWIIEPQVNYVRNLGKGKLDLLLGSTIQQNNAKGEYVQGLGHNTDEAMGDLNSAATITPLYSFITKYKYNALFGRLNYNWENKYIINLTARRDGSSRFGPANQFHNFASVGGAWIFSQEKFINENFLFLSFSKLRASYGTTGNDQIPDYSFLNLYSPVYVDIPYQNISGLISGALFNPYLQWEQTRKLQIGLDMGFLKDRILMNFTYQRNRSSNQLLTYNLPSMTGFTGVTSNFPATIENTSWELELNADIFQTSNFNWTTHINLTIPKNKLVAFPELANTGYANSYIIGQPISIARLYHSLGVDPATGEYIYADRDGKPTSSPDYFIDRTVTLNTSPKYYGGFQNSFSYKGLQLDILFQFVKQVGVSNIVSSGLFPGQFFRGFSNQPVTVLDRWQRSGDNASIAKYTTSPGDSYNNVYTSDYVYRDASYIRLKNLSLSWTPPVKWVQVVHLRHARIYVQGQNLLTITNYEGLDPESQENMSLPPLRIITMGIQVGF